VITGFPFVNITAMVVQTNDQVLFGGTFTNVGGLSRNGIARLDANGTVDANFDPGTGIMRHADAGYPEAIEAAGRHHLKLPGITLP